MKRILFVDDEPRVLDALRRMLRRRRPDWEMVVAPDGHTALKELASAPFDVVVSDMRMPVMDGAALLAEVRARHPQTVRIILSGQTDSAGAAVAAVVAHQFLAKPIDSDQLAESVDRACDLREMIGSDAIRRLVGEMGSLPAVPASYGKLLDLLRAGDMSPKKIGEVVSRDIGMSVKVLQLANSAMYGSPGSIRTLESAVARLGANFLTRLVLSTEVFQAHAVSAERVGVSIERLQQHSMLVAEIAGKLLPEAVDSQVAYIAGMLHCVGELALIDRMPEQVLEIWRSASERNIPVGEAEIESIGASGFQIGAYLLNLWALPDAIVEAVALQSPLGKPARTSAMAPLVVHVADSLAHEIAPDLCPIGGQPPQLDFETLGELGLLDRVELWRAVAIERHSQLQPLHSRLS